MSADPKENFSKRSKALHQGREKNADPRLFTEPATKSAWANMTLPASRRKRQSLDPPNCLRI